MKYLNTILLVCVLGVGVYLAVPKQEMVGGIYSNPGIVALGDSNLASSSFSALASASATTILASNPTRAYAICTNRGPSSIYLMLGTKAAINTGILVPASSSFTISATQNLYTGAVTAVSKAGPATVYSSGFCLER
jgi:hypothetical protein